MDVRTRITRIIRELAKNNYWQNLYSHAKDLGFKVFENNRDLTNNQMLFLHYLSFYSNLYMEFSMGDVGEIVFKDFIYEDAYTAYKRKKRKDKDVKGTRAEKKVQERAGEDKSSNFSWNFKTPKK